jgi:hypothetical protein
MSRSVGFIEVARLGLDNQLAAIGHGVAGVNREIHDHLFHLTRIRLHPADLLGKIGHHRNAVAFASYFT